MPTNITIPKPCHEDWNAMTPDDKGRHCAQCCKTVVDFTFWQPQEIIMYLREKSGERVCGRFTESQLNEPIPTPEDFVRQLHYFSVPFLKKAAAIFLFAFSVMAVSCNDHTEVAGKIAVAKVDTPPPTITGDTIIMQPLLGEPAVDLLPEPKKRCIKPVDQTVKGELAIVPEETMGIIAVEPTQPIVDPKVFMGDVMQVDPDTTKKKSF